MVGRVGSVWLIVSGGYSLAASWNKSEQFRVVLITLIDIEFVQFV